MAGATRLLPAYLVVGPDELKRKQTVTRLRAHVEGPFADFNLEELVASADMEPVGVLSSLNTLPMGGDLRVVIIENAGKLPKPVSEAVIEYLKAPNESCTLLLVAETLAKSTRLYKAVAKVGPRSVIECGAPKRRDLTPYVQKLAAAHGVGIDADAASELVSRVGESTTMLDNQLSALSALLGGQGQLTRAFVEQNVARTAEVKPWEFLDRIAERDARRSFELLALLRANSAIGLLSLVTGRIRAHLRKGPHGAGRRPRHRGGVGQGRLAGARPRQERWPLCGGGARGPSGGVCPRRPRPQDWCGRRRHHGRPRGAHLRRPLGTALEAAHPVRLAGLLARTQIV